jgi:hypothetical protein
MFNAGEAKADSDSPAEAAISWPLSWYVSCTTEGVEELVEVRSGPRISEADRVYITFDIAGQFPKNVQIEQSTGTRRWIYRYAGNPRIGTSDPCRYDYSGNKVSVEFWFDYKRWESVIRLICWSFVRRWSLAAKRHRSQPTSQAVGHVKNW